MRKRRVFVLLLSCLTGCGGQPWTLPKGDAGGGGEPDLAMPPPACFGLECQVTRDCPGGTHTTLTGRVYAPNGTLPLYNATVSVPNGALEPFTSGVSCDRCDGTVSGNPVAVALTDASGAFMLSDVPSGTNIPLVVQLGKWRRQITVPLVQNCETTVITDVEATRLPRNKSEGEIPQMAIATGAVDPMECLLRKIGIDDAEFTFPSSTGRVHFYKQNGVDMGFGTPNASTLWTDLSTLKSYDIVILPCEGGAYAKPSGARQNLVDYTALGGRLFTTHYSYVWLSYTGSPFNVIGTWNLDQSTPSPNPKPSAIDTSFPKGAAFADWLQNVGATTTRGTISISAPRHDIDATDPKYAQQWITATNPTQVFHLTFNTPLDAPPDPMGVPLYCGRVVYSDFHVSAVASSTRPFPSSCDSKPLTGQEQALAFMLFDLSSCVQKDTEPPIP